jgi:16S rRNA (guanine527-N7)-methyltransferase
MEKTPEGLEIVLQYFTDFSPAQIQQLAALGDLYKEWNAKINVISRKDIDSLYTKHILHSLAIAAAFPIKPGSDVIDIGTGGGFPGIPLAIFFPTARFHLVDSIGKKIKVVEAISQATGLTNITTRHSRAEDIKDRKFDLAVSRAVAPLKELWAWARPLLRPPSDRQRPSGLGARPISAPSGLICLKGGDLAAEISDSGTRPRIMEIHELFALDEFREKYLLQIPY